MLHVAFLLGLVGCFSCFHHLCCFRLPQVINFVGCFFLGKSILCWEYLRKWPLTNWAKKRNEMFKYQESRSRTWFYCLLHPFTWEKKKEKPQRQWPWKDQHLQMVPQGCQFTIPLGFDSHPEGKVLGGESTYMYTQCTPVLRVDSCAKCFFHPLAGDVYQDTWGRFWQSEGSWYWQGGAWIGSFQILAGQIIATIPPAGHPNRLFSKGFRIRCPT